MTLVPTPQHNVDFLRSESRRPVTLSGWQGKRNSTYVLTTLCVSAPLRFIYSPHLLRTRRRDYFSLLIQFLFRLPSQDLPWQILVAHSILSVPETGDSEWVVRQKKFNISFDDAL